MTQKNQVKQEKKIDKDTLHSPQDAGFVAPQGNMAEPQESPSKPMPNTNNVGESTPQIDLSAQVAQLKVEAEQMRDKFMRTYAEMENIKRRCQNEIEKNAKIAIADFAMDLLPVLDNLERALAQEVPPELKENVFIKNLFSGVQMTEQMMQSALAKNGVTVIESIGKTFDPNVHKVIQQVADETKEDGTIVQEWQKGYRIGGDRVLREAMVIVSSKP